MRWFIRVVLGIWLLIVIVLAAALGVGKLLDNGEMIAFQSSSDADTDIYLHDVRTGVTHNLTRQPGDPRSTRQLPNEDDVSMYPTQTQVWNYQGDDVAPAWSPDGRQLAFVSYREGNPDIYLLDLDTGGLRNLTNDLDANASPVWSPDGTKLAFESMHDGYWGISVIDLESHTIRDLTDHVFASQAPTWSPDSRQIAFQAKHGRYWDIYVVDLESGESHNLTNSARDDFNPVWAAGS